MSNPESFIDEVTEDLRRDRLFAAFRKHGWIGIMLVLLTVGGAAGNEYVKAQNVAKAQAFGDAVLDALALPAGSKRTIALASVPANATQAAFRDLLLAVDKTASFSERQVAFQTLVDDANTPQMYRDLAVLRFVLAAETRIDLAERQALLTPLATPGRPLRPLALEQLAYLKIELGDVDAAIADLKTLSEDQQSPAALRQRVKQIVLILGGQFSAG